MNKIGNKNPDSSKGIHFKYGIMKTVSSPRTFFDEANVHAHVDVYLFTSFVKYESTGVHCHIFRYYYFPYTC